MRKISSILLENKNFVVLKKFDNKRFCKRFHITPENKLLNRWEIDTEIAKNIFVLHPLKEKIYPQAILKVIKLSCEDEIHNQSLFSHLGIAPSIIDIYRISRKRLGVVMEYCIGDLYDLLNDYLPLNLMDSKELMIEILSCVGVLHKHNYAHRDLKLENIFLTNSGKIVLGDFEFASNETSFTESLYTRPYCPPEILTTCENRLYTKKCDVWNLGVIFYLILMGVFPFDCQYSDMISWFEIMNSKYPEISNILKNHVFVSEKNRFDLNEFQNFISKIE